MRVIAAAALAAACSIPAIAREQDAPPPLAVTGDIAPTHDPAIIKEGEVYHIFQTGPGIPEKVSTDLIHWKNVGPVLGALPDWAQKSIPGARDIWAPDISYFDGRYHLYYSVSTFGSNRSAVGLLTNKTLDRSSPDYRWRDEGQVIASTPQSDFNAIDPNHFIDADGRHWLVLGSFWTGIKMFALDPTTGKPGEKQPVEHPVARRLAPKGVAAPIEAPFLIRQGDFYYLFVSHDYCCKGVNSTYYTVVGRSRDVLGPYAGRDGSLLMNGQGTAVLTADLPEKNRWRGPGHSAILHDGQNDYIVYHAYDKEKNGVPTLRISPIRWTEDGWPLAAAN